MRRLALIAGILCCVASLARAQYGDEICKSMNQGKFWQAQKGQGDPQTIFCAGTWYENGTGVQPDSKTAVNYYRRAADLGYAPAQTAMGEAYDHGQGVPQNYAEALKWYRKAAEQGFAAAQNNLGSHYLDGRGTAKNRDEALRWFRLAAAHGSVTAVDNLKKIEIADRPQRKEPAEDRFQQSRRLYQSGDKAAAWKLCAAAAQAGNSSAQASLGWAYERGDGMPQSFVEAAKWYRKSADSGNPLGEANLGLLYEEGRGVQEDWIEAAKLYQQAADQNDSVGQAHLAYAFQFGMGVPHDRKMAVYWDRRAAAQGDGHANYWAERLNKPGGTTGVRNADEERYLGGGDRDNVEPKGVVFHNSGERNAWLKKTGEMDDAIEAETGRVMRNIAAGEKRDKYRSCVAAGGTDCGSPPP